MSKDKPDKHPIWFTEHEEEEANQKGTLTLCKEDPSLPTSATGSRSPPPTSVPVPANKKHSKRMYFFHRSDVSSNSARQHHSNSSSNEVSTLGPSGGPGSARYTLGRLCSEQQSPITTVESGKTASASANPNAYSSPLSAILRGGAGGGSGGGGGGDQMLSTSNLKVSSAYDTVSSGTGLVNVLRKQLSGGTATDSASNIYPLMKPRPAIIDDDYTGAIPRSLDSPVRGRSANRQETISNAVPTHHQTKLQSGSGTHVPASQREPSPESAAVGLTPVLTTSMPKGRYVVVNMLTTWGDAHEIGMCGVEMFNEHGVRIVPSAVSSATAGQADAAAPPRTTTPPPSHGRAPTPDNEQTCTQGLTIEERVTALTYSAADKSLCMLAEYSSSPQELDAVGKEADMTAIRRDPRRQLSNIVGGVLNTRDEGHMFAIPYTPGHHHLVCFVFPHPITLSMVRLYNYNGKGRVHTSKGVRIMEMTMDDVVIFRGEVAQSSGELVKDPSQIGLVNCENILFTQDAAILTRVMAGQQAESLTDDDGEEGRASSGSMRQSRLASRGVGGGITVVLRSNKEDAHEYVGGSTAMTMTAGPGTSAGALFSGAKPPARPSTGGAPSAELSISRVDSLQHGAASFSPTRDTHQAWESAQQQQQQQHKKAQYPTHCPRSVVSLCIMFLSTWGDTQQIGLSGLRLRDASGDIIQQPISAGRVRYPDGSYHDAASQEELQKQIPFLFDESVETACTLPFMLGMQLVITFEEPIPTLGFLEVANYSVEGHTFCGAKDVRVFLASTGAKKRTGTTPAAAIATYEHLWSLGASADSRRALQQSRVMEVTPSEGVSLRKAPAHLPRPRFQTYDLSLQSTGPMDDDEGDDSHLVGFHIGIGPGTGGGVEREDDGAFMGGGRPGMQVANASFANSLNASMNIRAAMAMKRARMMLRERPLWVLEYQPYITPLLPVGYVLKVRMHICARAVGRQTAAHSVYISAQETLKGYLKTWVTRPMESVLFFNESGIQVTPMRPGPAAVEAIAALQEEDEPDKCIIPMVSECVLTTLPTPAAVAATNVNLSLELVYVADMPFCLSALRLNKPLVLDGSTAWVKRQQVYMDDSMVFDSGDASLEVKKQTAPPPASDGAGVQLPACGTSLKPFVLFTLDPSILDDIKSAAGMEA